MEKVNVDLKEIIFDELLTKAAATKTEITVTIEPDRREISIQPWNPFKYKCPAAPSKTEELPDRPEPGMEPVLNALGTKLWTQVVYLAFVKDISFSDMLRELTEKGMTMGEKPHGCDQRKRVQ